MRMLCLLALLLVAPPLRGQEIVFAASDIARTLALEMRQYEKTAVGVSSLRDEKGEATRVGAFLAEEIASQLGVFAGPEIKLVERSRVDAIFDEQRMGIDGLREAGRLDAFVEVLQVDAIVVGTISTLPELGGKARINARLIAVPTGELLASASAFAAVESSELDGLPAEETLPRTSTMASRGRWKTLEFEVKGCRRAGRDLVCELFVTNENQDQEVEFRFGRTHLYDQRGRRFKASSGRVANLEGTGDVELRLVSEVPTHVEIRWEGLPSGIDIVKVLDLGLVSYEVGWGQGNVELRNIVVDQ